MPPIVAEILHEHVTFELESVDRLYLNGYVPGLQAPEAVAYFLRKHRGAQFASSILLDQISRDFARGDVQNVSMAGSRLGHGQGLLLVHRR